MIFIKFIINLSNFIKLIKAAVFVERVSLPKSNPLVKQWQGDSILVICKGTSRLIFANTFISGVPNVNKWRFYCLDFLLAKNWLEK